MFKDIALKTLASLDAQANINCYSLIEYAQITDYSVLAPTDYCNIAENLKSLGYLSLAENIYKNLIDSGISNGQVYLGLARINHLNKVHNLASIQYNKAIHLAYDAQEDKQVQLIIEEFPEAKNIIPATAYLKKPWIERLEIAFRSKVLPEQYTTHAKTYELSRVLIILSAKLREQRFKEVVQELEEKIDINQDTFDKRFSLQLLKEQILSVSDNENGLQSAQSSETMKLMSLESCINYWPENPAALIELAKTYIKRKEYKKAEEKLLMVYNFDGLPRYLRDLTMVLLADVNRSFGRFSLMASYYESIVDTSILDPFELDLLINYHLDKHNEKALRIINLLFASGVEYGSLYHRRSYISRKIGDIEDAIVDLEQTSAIVGQDTNVNIAKVNKWRLLKDLEAELSKLKAHNDPFYSMREFIHNPLVYFVLAVVTVVSIFVKFVQAKTSQRVDKPKAAVKSKNLEKDQNVIESEQPKSKLRQKEFIDTHENLANIPTLNPPVAVIKPMELQASILNINQVNSHYKKEGEH